MLFVRLVEPRERLGGPILCRDFVRVVRSNTGGPIRASRWPHRCGQLYRVGPTTMKKDMTHRLALYETAQEFLGFLVAERAKKILSAMNDPGATAEQIEQWEAEQQSFIERADALSMQDEAKLEQVVAELGPLVRASFNGG